MNSDLNCCVVIRVSLHCSTWNAIRMMRFCFSHCYVLWEKKYRNHREGSGGGLVSAAEAGVEVGRDNVQLRQRELSLSLQPSKPSIRAEGIAVSFNVADGVFLRRPPWWMNSPLHHGGVGSRLPQV